MTPWLRCIMKHQQRQFTYNMIVGHVLETNVAVESNKYYIF
jgi:hypothetical protein